MSSSQPSTSYAPQLQQDEIIPLFAMDLFKFAQAFTGSFKYVINGALDTSVLTRACDELISRGNWRKMGARIRKNEAGTLEWHVPRQYTKDRPAYRLTTYTYDSPSAAGLHIPAATEHAPSIQSDLGPEHIFVHPGTPITMADYLDPEYDRPCFNLHVTTFRDNSVTCLGITFPHIFCDGAGIAQFLMSWVRLVNDINAPTATLHGYDTDPFAPLEHAFDFSNEPVYVRTKEAEMQEVMYNMRLQEEFEKHPKETRTVYVPPGMVKQLHQDALLELKQRRAAGEDVPEYLSDQGIIIAWWIKSVFGDKTDDTTPLITLVGSSLRKSLKELFPKNTIYVHNATLAFASSPVPLSAMHTLTPASLAIAARSAMLAQTKDTETLKRAVALKLWSNRVSSAPVSAAAAATWHFTTTWKDAACLEWDWSGALLQRDRGEIQDGRPGGTRAYSGALILNSPFPARGLLTILAKTREGGYWLQPCLRKDDWAKLSLDRLTQSTKPRMVRAKL
ncbi:hypothetical protein OE88DRAFT_1646269 [Heliocybe sulcata]|uniref:Transferase-domain-containing protein n=1 Tax=Heliocybe sulcata TaxID=5364 RepID=A0A5C3MYJ3_9AGAM|nr:hypothetical protein OE88DRAFT_1646269 [Heliocybe sulcata]